MKKSLLFIFLIIVTFNINAATYYISPTGVDTNSGTNETAPLKTIQAGINKATMANDIVSIKPGIYPERITINNNNITVTAYDLNNKPVIDGNYLNIYQPNTNFSALIIVTGNSNNISNIEVKNSNVLGKFLGGYGVQVTGTYNVLDGLKVHHSWEQGVLLTGDYNTIQNSEVYLNAIKNSSNPGNVGAWGNGISSGRNTSGNAIVADITSYTVIKNNIVYNNYGEGIKCFETYYCSIEKNTLYDNWTSELYLSDSKYAVVKKNLIYNSTAPDISFRNNTKPLLLTLTDDNAGKPRSSDNVVINNVYYNGNINLFNTTAVSGNGLTNVVFSNNTLLEGKLLTADVGNVSANSNILNNIIFSNIVSAVPTKTGITFGYNNWSVTPSVNASSLTDVIGNPSLIKNGATTPGSLTPLYFKLGSGSGVINKGSIVTEVTDDIFDTLRSDGKPDIGAHEYIVSTISLQPKCKLICTVP